MSLWNRQYTLDEINAKGRGTLGEALGMRFTRIGDDYLEATMPVDHRTKQPEGLLHGGASVALAETLASVASVLTEKSSGKRCVGVEINANHLRPVTGGEVTGRVSPIRLGSSLHVWEVRIKDSHQKLSCVSRVTIATLGQKPTSQQSQ